MLNKIIDNLINYPEDECYEISRKKYKNRDLYKYVCNIYHYLLDNNKSRKSVIVCGHKDIYMIASFLACSCAGMTYVPIDVSIPEQRKESIIKQIDPEIIIDKSIKKIMTNDNYNENIDIYMKDNDIYYIIFTSGSTGEPKGVQITYSNLKSCMKWVQSICPINKGVILNQANYSFDLSVADLYLPLLTRSKHYVIEREIQKDYNLLFKELKNSNSNLAVFTPSFLDMLLVDKSFDKKLLPNLSTILLCGERLTEKTVDKVLERFPDLNLINSYGPTECTFAVTSIRIIDSTDISIGVPKDDVKIYIVDEASKELNDGEIGEILITGDSVGNGYLNNNSNNNPNNNFTMYKGQKGYHTGDLGYRKNGKYYCIGRKDTQIKFKGYRIELAEIEKVIDNLEYVDKSVIETIKNDEGRIKRIVAFIKLKNMEGISVKNIKNKLENVLPDYMIPTIRTIKEIPLTANGKIDSKKLLEEYNNERTNN